MSYFFSDNPALDFERWDREQNRKFRARIASCNCCGGEIEEGETALEWEMGDLILCEECVGRFLKPLKHESVSYCYE